jgi:hypothetical protein
MYYQIQYNNKIVNILLINKIKKTIMKIKRIYTVIHSGLVYRTSPDQLTEPDQPIDRIPLVLLVLLQSPIGKRNHFVEMCLKFWVGKHISLI